MGENFDEQEILKMNPADALRKINEAIKKIDPSDVDIRERIDCIREEVFRIIRLNPRYSDNEEVWYRAWGADYPPAEDQLPHHYESPDY